MLIHVIATDDDVIHLAGIGPVLPVAAGPATVAVCRSNPRAPEPPPPPPGIHSSPVAQHATQRGSRSDSAALQCALYTERTWSGSEAEVTKCYAKHYKTRLFLTPNMNHEVFILLLIRKLLTKLLWCTLLDIKRRAEAQIAEGGFLWWLSHSESCKWVSHSQRLIIDWVQCLFLHWCLLFTVIWLVWQEIGLYISAERKKKHPYIHHLIDSLCDTADSTQAFAWTRIHLRVRAVLTCRSNVLTAKHFHMELLFVSIVNQWVLDATPHFHHTEIPRAEQTHHASTELQTRTQNKDQRLRHCPKLTHLASPDS